MLNLYVSPSGNDQWSGLRKAPASRGKEGPLATLEGARDAVRRLEQAGKTASGVTVWLANGTYVLPHSFELGPHDSGTSAAPAAPNIF